MSLTSLRFVHRFRSGTLGTLIMEYAGKSYTLTYTWNGPRPPHGGERLKWAKECHRIFANRFRTPVTYATAAENGKPVVWRFIPGQQPRRIPPEEARIDAFTAAYAVHYNIQGDLL